LKKIYKTTNHSRNFHVHTDELRACFEVFCFNRTSFENLLGLTHEFGSLKMCLFSNTVGVYLEMWRDAESPVRGFKMAIPYQTLVSLARSVNFCDVVM